MEDVKENAEIKNEDFEEDGVTLVMKLRKPVDFEGVNYKEIDLTALENLTTSDLIFVRRMMNSSGASIELYPERTHEFACYAASLKTGKPYEFFTSLSAADGMELKRRVQDFLY